MSKFACQKLLRILWRWGGRDMLARAGKAQAGAAAQDSRSQADRRGRDKLQEGPQLHDGHSRKVFDAFFEQIGIEGREPIDLVSADGAR